MEDLQQTIEEYNQGSQSGVDSFGKTSFPIDRIEFNEKIFLAQVTPVIHYTLGGIMVSIFFSFLVIVFQLTCFLFLQIDSHARVLLEESHEPIQNLYAAGESTGGVHGADRLGGNSLLECVVFGRIAGKEVIKLLTEKYSEENDEL